MPLDAPIASNVCAAAAASLKSRTYHALMRRTSPVLVVGAAPRPATDTLMRAIADHGQKRSSGRLGSVFGRTLSKMDFRSQPIELVATPILAAASSPRSLTSGAFA